MINLNFNKITYFLALKTKLATNLTGLLPFV
jgi:hypothetical protein